ncbi:uncharacterized protein [Periplaneta americana]|uniref:uncharacterized protein isoform X5 n=1 Tax=Periplaneta americana TaxID=6978 RepID=UPI0037E94C1C
MSRISKRSTPAHRRKGLKSLTAFSVKDCPVMSSTNCICCCCTTRSATIILAWLVLITTVTAMELCIYALTTMDLRYSYALKAIIIGLILSLFGEALLLGSFLYGIHTLSPVTSGTSSTATT